MEFRIKNQKRALILGFSLIILMIMMLGVVSKIQLTRMANTMNQLYTHPYIVSNTTQEIKFNLVSIQRYMKNAVLAKSAKELSEVVILIESHEIEVFKGFDLLSDRYLGEKHAINDSYRMVIQWQPIRAEIIRLASTEDSEKAFKVAKEREVTFLKLLMHKIQLINDFSNNKAKDFQQEFIKEKQSALWINYIFTFCSILFIIILAARIIRRTVQSEIEKNDKNHLIDQSIMLAKLDNNGVVLDVSNALCRFLDQNKSQLIGQNSYFFDNSKRSKKINSAILSVLKTGAEWRGEIQYINGHGKSCWAQSTIVPSYDKHYQVTSFTNTLVSVTNKKLAVIDELTSLLNRRGFDAILSREYQNAQRDSCTLSLAILDIDYFKKFNDLYGHPKGDEALRQVSSVIHSVVDEACFAFRIGGEEFAIVFVGHSLETTKQKLLWLKEQVESLKILHKDNQVSDYLTLSIGAFASSSSSKIEEGRLYSIADKILYQAKQKRNTLVLTSEYSEEVCA